MRRPVAFPIDLSEHSLFSRRDWIVGGCSLLAPVVLGGNILFADDDRPLIDRERQTIRVWDGRRQVVIAYQQGETKGEPCRQLAAAELELPVKLMWQLPPEWVKRFPTVHFLTSCGRWQVCEGWTDVASFIDRYDDFNPPERSPRQVSPFKNFLQYFQAPYWSWPGGITNHLLDPSGPHRFSEFELRGLKTSEKKRLHVAHHQGIVEPGRRPPTEAELAAGIGAIGEALPLGH